MYQQPHQGYQQYPQYPQQQQPPQQSQQQPSPEQWVSVEQYNYALKNLVNPFLADANGLSDDILRGRNWPMIL